ncbi:MULTISPECIES: VWA domain-containing protein [unclassified Streptomyces]|uniref:vWA domain-containing protein n=1 Tax=unclassified Streptomyces TaxID=2593676 RepID=UPI00190D4881|nr:MULTISPECIES: VWA domain-containing protein [unclassified Streptomyces]MBK3569245.1 VWA domain-containing protein [Streptomyces sp. MBT62]MBK6017854.1 VWA domain-containing protein [Streptomyces sp. MBT53]
MANFSKSNVPQFSVDVYQNEYLPEGGREVNAIVTVTSTGGGTVGSAVAAPHLYSPGQGPDAAVAIMVDCSGSMDYPPTKMRNARDATAAAIDTLRDGVHFAVIGGTHIAKEVYPGNGRLAVADATTRDQAKQALRKLSAGGGTAIGTWLRLADRLLSSADVSIRHGIVLTDGRNEHEAPEDLKAALDACAGRFTCDARGVGTDWEVKEVTGIASALLGTADIVADPANLAADFTKMMETAMGKEVADVALRLWTPVGTAIKFVKQVAPRVEELTDRRTEAGPRAGDYPTGSWGDESRDYHVCVEVPEAGIGQEMLAARVSLVVPQPDGSTQNLGAQGLVKAVWTDDMVASTSINPQVAHYTGQAELAQVIQQGLDLRKSGDVDGATAKLGRAVQLASVSGNADTAKLLAKVVDVVDAAAGTVRLKAKVAEADEMTLETRSTKTVRVKK